jgi:hypothetical protein
MTSQNVWKMSILEHFFNVLSLYFGSGIGYETVSKWKVETGSGSASQWQAGSWSGSGSKWQAGSGSASTWCGSATLAKRQKKVKRNDIFKKKKERKEEKCKGGPGTI